MRSASIIGLGSGVIANLLWGLAFIIPSVLSPSYTPVEVTLGRYLFYGLVSCTVLLFLPRPTLVQLRADRAIWAKACLFCLIGNFAYYCLLVIGISYAGAPVAVLVVGLLPISVAYYGNWLRHEFPYARLVVPTSWVAAGLLLMNLPAITGQPVAHGSPLLPYLLGVGCDFAALACWTWYGVENAEFLKSHPQISASTWSTLVGIAAFGLVLCIAPVLIVLRTPVLRLAPFVVLNRSLLLFLLGSLILGAVLSWGCALLWNRASLVLPISFAGQLIGLETVSGLMYAYWFARRLPSALELVGSVCVIIGVMIGVKILEDSSGKAGGGV